MLNWRLLFVSLPLLLRNVIRSKFTLSSVSSFSTLGPMLPGTRDLLWFRSFKSFVIPFRVMSISSSTGNQHFCDTSLLLENTDMINCLFSYSALSTG